MTSDEQMQQANHIPSPPLPGERARVRGVTCHSSLVTGSAPPTPALASCRRQERPSWVCRRAWAARRRVRGGGTVSARRLPAATLEPSPTSRWPNTLTGPIVNLCEPSDDDHANLSGTPRFRCIGTVVFDDGGLAYDEPVPWSMRQHGRWRPQVDSIRRRRIRL